MTGCCARGPCAGPPRSSSLKSGGGFRSSPGSGDGDRSSPVPSPYMVLRSTVSSRPPRPPHVEILAPSCGCKKHARCLLLRCARCSRSADSESNGFWQAGQRTTVRGGMIPVGNKEQAQQACMAHTCFKLLQGAPLPYTSHPPGWSGRQVHELKSNTYKQYIQTAGLCQYVRRGGRSCGRTAGSEEGTSDQCRDSISFMEQPHCKTIERTDQRK